jgi:tRNA(Ile)-lysidine synthase
MEDSLAIILSKECQLRTNWPVLVGVSGGPDSLCLMDILDRLGYPVLVAYFNHSLRQEADQEAQQVARLAQARGIRFILGKEDTQLFARTNSLSIEEAARTLRYRFLFEQARMHAAQAVAVAHTADDQVETVLMHFLRGAGLEGLTGMAVRALPNPWSEKIPLVRPLLSIWREAILAYCTGRGLQPVYDSSNQDLLYFRNRLRLDLIPFLTGFNPAIKRVIWRSSEVMKGENKIIQTAVEQDWQICVLEAGEGFVAFDARNMAQQPAGMQRRIFRRAIAHLRPGLRDIGFDAIERALDFLSSSKKPGQVDLVSNLRLVNEPGKLWVAEWEAELPVDEWPQMPRDQEIWIEGAGEIKLLNGWQLEVKPVQVTETVWRLALSNQDPYQAWLAVDIEKDPLCLRTVRPRDRFQPMGMAGESQKVSDFMINHKLPRRARPGWPLVCLGEAIIWVPGYRLGNGIQLSTSTWQALYLILKRNPG